MKLNVGLVKANNKLHISVLKMSMLPGIFLSYMTRQDYKSYHSRNSRGSSNCRKMVKSWLRWFGHVCSRPKEALMKKVVEWRIISI